MKNIFISFESGDSALMYTETLTAEECAKFANAVNKGHEIYDAVIDCYEITDDDIQYYCINGRIWADTPERESRVRAIINN